MWSSEMTKTSTSKTLTAHTRIAIIGTGFAGLGAAIRLLERGEQDLLLLEKADDVGGCWRDNTYPGLQCDVQSVVYSFSFEPNPDWTRAFPWGKEIYSYLRGCADKYDLRSRIHFNTEVLKARWDDSREHWEIETSRGLYTAHFLLSAHGALSSPKSLKFKGIEKFSGHVFHSAKWRHDVPLRDKRVAVIGTGASAIQIVPSIQPEVDELQLYQRSPAWVLPRPDGPISGLRRLAYRRLPWTQKLTRLIRFILLESRIIGILTRPEIMILAERLALRHMHEHIKESWMREALRPQESMGQKRVLLSNDYYPALAKPNTHLITSPIREITEHHIITEDGAEREVDVIVMCTGFNVADHPITQNIYGRDGRSLADHWSDVTRAYLGMAVPDFPNMFLLMSGPHVGLGHNSIVYMIESQVQFVCDALAAQREHSDAVLEVKDDAVDTYTQEMQRKLKGTIWNSGTSFYYDDRGRNIAIWPGFAFTYRRRSRKFEVNKFTLQPRRGRAASENRQARSSLTEDI